MQRRYASAMVALFIVSASAFSQTVVYVDEAAPPSGDGATWASAFNSLQDALATAPVNSEIWVARGTYRPDSGLNQTPGNRNASFLLRNGVAVYGGFAGTEMTRGERAWWWHESILCGDLSGDDELLPADGPPPTSWNENSRHVVTATGVTTSTAIDGFTIRGGNADGMFADLSNLGGGLLCRNGASPRIANCRFKACAGKYGAGCSLYDQCRPRFDRCVFVGNYAYDEGGGLYCEADSDSSLLRCVFDSNRSGGSGGAVFNYDRANPAFVSCSFYSNASGADGGAMNSSTDSGPLLVNCVVVANSAADDGGGVRNSSGSLGTIINCTFFGNAADNQGGGLANNGVNSIVANTILWANVDSAGSDQVAQVFNSGATPVVNHCCIQGLTGSLGGTGNFAFDPQFIDSDGPDDLLGTGDDNLRLAAGSPCANSGNTGHLPADSADCDGDSNVTESVPCDRDGAPRVLVGNVDVGALEDAPLKVHNVSQNTSYSTIQAAIDGAANSQVIVLYPGVLTGDGNRDINFHGKSITIQGVDPLDSTIVAATRIFVNATYSDRHRAFRFTSGEQNTSRLRGVTITKGYHSSGGALRCDASSPHFEHCVFVDNTVTEGGEYAGGGAVYSSDGNPRFMDCAFLANGYSRPSPFHGGAVHCSGGNPVFSRCVFDDNQAIDLGDDAGIGGAMQLFGGRVEHSIFRRNYCQIFGGAIDAHSAILLDCVFQDNWGEQGGGGVNAVDSTIARCRFIGNRVTDGYADGGGGLRATECTVLDCDFVANHDSGGAGLSYSGGGGGLKCITSTVENCTFEHNVRSVYDLPTGGGGVFSDGSTLRDCVIQNNTSGGSYGVGGGGIEVINGTVLERCIIASNVQTSIDSTAGGDGMLIGHQGMGSMLSLTNVTFAGRQLPGGSESDPPSDPAFAWNSTLTMTGDNIVRHGWLESWASTFNGTGRLILEQDGVFRVGGYEPAYGPTRLQAALMGTGDLRIDSAQRLIVEMGAVVDLSGEVIPTDCGSCPGSNPSEWGSARVDGILEIRDGVVQNTNVSVNILNSSGSFGIINNDISLLAASDGIGGQFFAGPGSRIRCNRVRSLGDRYLDLDPDADAINRPMVCDNTFTVVITQGGETSQGELLELRSPDCDCASGLCGSGPMQTVYGLGYTSEWALELLQVGGLDDNGGMITGAKVNLTNRPGFDFRQAGNCAGSQGASEALYVRTLKLGPDAICNTGLQRLYFRELYLIHQDGSETAVTDFDNATPFLTFSNGSRFEDIPLLGFSLGILQFNDNVNPPPHDEFSIRVRTRLLNNANDDPSRPNTPLGTIARVDGVGFGGSGAMRMRTQTGEHPAANSVASHGAFARAGDEDTVVAFRYRFVSGPPASSLLVYLSDQPNISEGNRFLSEIRPTPSGPGSMGYPEYSTFFGTFARGQLNFTRGTYVEVALEAGGASAEVLIDDLDPQVICTTICGDFDGYNNRDHLDYFLALANFGETTDPFSEQGRSQLCIDAHMSGDNYIDANDMPVWDVMHLFGCLANGCCSGFGTIAVPFAQAFPSVASPTPLPASDMLIAGKPRGDSDEPLAHDALYLMAKSGLGSAAPLCPGSGGSCRPRGNGRLISGPNGTIYQLHAVEGLINLASGTRVIPPQSGPLPSADGAGVVYLGPVRVDAETVVGQPMLDVAFDPTNSNRILVGPVTVRAPNCDCTFTAAASILVNGSDNVLVERVYGQRPPQLPCDCDPGDLIVVQPDYTRVREIEADAFGNLFVIASQSIDANDWLLIYRVNESSPYRAIPMHDAQCGPIEGPTALLLSRYNSNKFYVSSSVRDEQSSDAHLWEFNISRSGGIVSANGISCSRRLHLGSPSVPGWNGDRFAMITALAETSDGEILATGLVSPRLSATDWPPQGDDQNHMFTHGVFCRVAPTGAPTCMKLLSEAPNSNDLALPLSIVARRTACDGDIDGNGQVTLQDLAYPLAHFGQTACASLADGDLDGDGDVDLQDLAYLLARFGASC